MKTKHIERASNVSKHTQRQARGSVTKLSNLKTVRERSTIEGRETANNREKNIKKNVGTTKNTREKHPRNNSNKLNSRNNETDTKKARPRNVRIQQKPITKNYKQTEKTEHPITIDTKYRTKNTNKHTKKKM